jgi:uncharacterized protein
VTFTLTGIVDEPRARSTSLVLELRPSCEACGTALAPDSTQAMICSFECTFCRTCVETLLENVCPNCGGGLCPRPIRPKAKLEKNPADTRVVSKPVDAQAHAVFAARIKDLPPELR